MSKSLPDDMPARSQWLAMLKRRDSKPSDLAKTTLALELPDGGRLACAMIDLAKPRFERLASLRKAVMLLLEETPGELMIGVYDNNADVARDAAYVALINGAPLPEKRKNLQSRCARFMLLALKRMLISMWCLLWQKAICSHVNSPPCRPMS